METHEIGSDSNILKDIISGAKRIEIRLGKPRFLEFKVGDHLSFREDIWSGNQLTASKPSATVAEITEIKQFRSLEELFNEIDYHLVLPEARDIQNAIAVYRKFIPYSDELNLGVLAFYFKLLH